MLVTNRLVVSAVVLVGLLLFPVASIVIAGLLSLANRVAVASVGPIPVSGQLLMYGTLRLAYFFAVGFTIGRKVRAAEVLWAAAGGLALALMLVVLETVIGRSLVEPAGEAWCTPTLVFLARLFSAFYVVLSVGLQTAAALLGGVASRWRPQLRSDHMMNKKVE